MLEPVTFLRVLARLVLAVSVSSVGPLSLSSVLTTPISPNVSRIAPNSHDGVDAVPASPARVSERPGGRLDPLRRPTHGSPALDAAPAFVIPAHVRSRTLSQPTASPSSTNRAPAPPRGPPTLI
jgi:hypothetical protein